MALSELKKRARSGDVLLVKSEKPVGVLIRVLTGESTSHVATVVWALTDSCRELVVYEFVEGVGYQVVNLEKWFDDRQGQKVEYGVAPVEVHARPHRVQAAAESYTNAGRLKRSYGYLSLVKVWLSQLLRCRIPVRQKVCSTFVQEVWRAAGYDQIQRTADPGDIAEHCQARFPLWR